MMREDYNLTFAEAVKAAQTGAKITRRYYEESVSEEYTADELVALYDMSQKAKKESQAKNAQRMLTEYLTGIHTTPPCDPSLLSYYLSIIPKDSQVYIALQQIKEVDRAKLNCVFKRIELLDDITSGEEKADISCSIAKWMLIAIMLFTGFALVISVVANLTNL